MIDGFLIKFPRATCKEILTFLTLESTSLLFSSDASKSKINAKRQRPRAPIACVYGNFATENEVSDCHISLDFGWKTHRDVDRFACPCRSYEQTRLLMRHQLLHQECIPHGVHSWHNNLVKRHFLRDGWRIFDFFSPQFPFTHPLEKQNTGRQIHSTNVKFWMRSESWMEDLFELSFKAESSHWNDTDFDSHENMTIQNSFLFIYLCKDSFWNQDKQQHRK